MFLLVWLMSDIAVAHPDSRTLVCGSAAWNRLIRRPVEAHCKKLPSDHVCSALEEIRTCSFGEGVRFRPDDPPGRDITAERAADGSWSLRVSSGGAEGDWCVKATIRGARVTGSTSEEYRL
jgi:hypothetical protein